MAVAIPFIMIAGAAISAYGAVQQAQAQKTAAQYNAGLSERNALVARQQADAAVLTQRRQAAQMHGTMVAGYGASGVELEGSPLDVMAYSVSLAKLDEANIRYRAELQAMGHQESATLDRMAGQTAEQQGYLNSASHFMTGIGRAGSSYASIKEPPRSYTPMSRTQ